MRLKPAIVQDAESGSVLMLAWMDSEAERRTRETGEAWFWSRSRRELWHKGATSGNTLAVRGRPQGSYVASLLDEGVAACARKVGEEGVEAAVAALGESDERVIEEVADLWFHSYVLLAARGLDPSAVEDELTRRVR